MTLPTTDNVSPIWKQAIKKYEDITNKKLDDPALKNITTVPKLLDAIEAENKRFDGFRSNKRKIFDALAVALKPIETVSNLAAGGASTVFPPSALVFGAVTGLLNAAKGVAECYDAIVDLLSNLKDFTVRLETYSQQAISTGLSEKLAEILATLIEIFAISRKEIKRGRFLSFGKSLLVGNDKIKDAIKKLARLVEGEKGLVAAETLTGVKTISSSINEINLNLDQLTKDVADMLQANGADKNGQNMVEKEEIIRAQLKRILQPGTYAEDLYTSIKRKRMKDTGNWIRFEDTFHAWLRNEHQVLYINGPPGVGKSYISSRIIDYLFERYPRDITGRSRDTSIGYFFFKDDNTKTRSFHQALREIAFQLCKRDESYAKYILRNCQDSEDIATLESAWRILFSDFFIEQDAANHTCIVLDGLDESDEQQRKEFFELARSVAEGSGSIRLLMLGRPEITDEIYEHMEIPFLPNIRIKNQNNSDIVRYIEESIKKSIYLKKASESLRSEIIAGLSSGADGMFIWVYFMMRDISSKRSEAAIRKALNEAPRGLNDMIRHVLSGFSSSDSLRYDTEHAENLNEMLAWVTCVSSPLKLAMLDSILKWRSESGEGSLYLERTLREQFASLFLVNRADGLNTADLERIESLDKGKAWMDDEGDEDTPSNEDETENTISFESDPATTEVTFNHASIGEFFRNSKNGKISAGEGCPAIGVDYCDAQVLVTDRCLEYICTPKDSPRFDLSLVLRKYAMEQYTWIKFLQNIDIKTIPTTAKMSIGKSLILMFNDDTVMARLSPTLDDKFFTKENAQLIKTWLCDAEVQVIFSDETKNWVQQAVSENELDLFLPLLRKIASGLENSGKRCTIITASIARYICLREGRKIISPISADMTIEAIEWIGSEKTGEWYFRLGYILFLQDYWQKALEYFQKALDTGKVPYWTISAAHVNMGLCYKNLDDVDRWLEMTKKNIDEGEKFGIDPKNLHVTYWNLGIAYEKYKMDSETALDYYKKAFAAATDDTGCIYPFIRIYYEMKRYQDLVDLLRGLTYKPKGKDCSLLTEFLIELDDGNGTIRTKIAESAKESKCIQWFVGSYLTAINWAGKVKNVKSMAKLELELAESYSQQFDDQERAIQMWEGIYRKFHPVKPGTPLYTTCATARMKLTSQFLNKLFDIDPKSKEGVRIGARIKSLARPNQFWGQFGNNKLSFNEIGTWLSEAQANDFILLLGHYYRLTNRMNDAIICYTVIVKDCIRLLTDELPDNDWSAYSTLRNVLFAANDDDNALAIAYDQIWTFNFSDKVELPYTLIPHLKRGAYGYHCDICSTKYPTVDGTVLCRYCVDINLCVGCLENFQKGAVDKTIKCHPKHDFLVAPPGPSRELLLKKPEGKIWFKGEYIDIPVWRKQLVTKWKLEPKDYVGFC